MQHRVAVAALTGALLAATVGVAAPPAQAQLQQPAVVSPVPASGTPQILDGTVYAAAQVGSTMVVGGSFTRTQSSDPDHPYPTPYVLAFDASTGAVKTAFAPRLDGIVQAVLPGPVEGTVYVGGLFKTMGGVAAKGLVLLSVADGTRVRGFTTPALDNANVQTLARHRNRLFVGGAFTKVGGVVHRGLATLNATTGALDPFMASGVSVNHSWTTTSPSNQVKASVGVSRISVTPDGTKLVAIGNFKQVDGATHDQIAMWDLTGSTAALRPWNTHRLEPVCSTSYDSYARDVDFSPDGSYFVLVTTGGYGPAGSLCDSATRWESAATGSDLQPTWVNYSGVDSLLSVAVTGQAVYVGGHQRWLDNPWGYDSAGPGAVPRPGVGALDPQNGVALAWNPGRNPRGAGTYVLYPTSSGLWMGSDTNYVGNRKYKRSKIAFFPLAAGSTAASTSLPGLPGPVYSRTAPSAPASGVLHRVNAGGQLLRTTDAGPDWAADSPGAPSESRTNGTGATSYDSPVPALDATVPAGTPVALFDAIRWDAGSRGDGHEMQWRFPVPAGTAVDVRLYFADRCACTGTPGSRTFDVALDGETVATGVDVGSSAGASTATMRSYRTTSDGSIDVSLLHRVENPMGSAVEVVEAGTAPYPVPAGTLTARSFDGTTAGAGKPVPSPLAVDAVRGAVVLGNTLFYGKTDSAFYRRTWSGSSWGAEKLVDPYNDPVWAEVDTGSGNRYRGKRPAFYSQITNLTSLWYSGGRLYYTLYDRSGLFSRAFSPESGIVHPEEVQAPGVELPEVTGAFLADGKLYYATRATGELVRVGFSGGALTGTPTVVSGPSQDSTDWRSSALFLGRADAPPVAAATVHCIDLSCTADGSRSSDAEGSIASYTWSWGDGTTSTGVRASHEYRAAGTYPVTLTVTDSAGAKGTTSTSATARNRPASTVAFRGSSSVMQSSGPALRPTVPAKVRPGDALLLHVATSGTGTAPKAPAGWREVSRQVWGSALEVVWQRVATSADTPGKVVQVELATSSKATAQVLAYSGTAASVPASLGSTSAESAATTEHVARGANVRVTGSWVVTFWTDKSSSTKAWTLPAGLRLRASGYGTGSGHLTTVAADEGAARSRGTSPATTARTDAASKAEATTVVLAPR